MSFRNVLASRFKAQLASKFIRASAGALLIVGLARFLDPDGYGLLFLAFSVFSIFRLVTIGIGRSAGRYVAEYKENDSAQVFHIVRSSLVFVLGLTVVAVIALFVSFNHIASLLGEPELAPFIRIGIPFVALGMSIVYLEKILQGFEAIRFVAVLGIFERVSRLLLALGLVILGYGAIGALAGYVLAALLATVVGFVYLFHRVRTLRETGSEIEPGLRRRMAEYAIPTTSTNMAKFMDSTIDTLLVGYFLSPVAVSFYVVGEQVMRFVETPLSAMDFTLSPTFGAQKAAGNIDRVSRLYEKALLNGLLFYFPAGIGIFIVADPMIHLVFGPEYAGAVPVLQVLGLYVILKAVTKVSDNGLDFLGRARERAIAKVFTAGLNVALNVILIPAIGVVGAAIATLITHGLYTAANVFIVAQEFDLRIAFLLKRIGLIAGISATMAVVVFGLSGFISGWITLMLVIGVGGFVWAVLSVATGLLPVREIASLVV